LRNVIERALILEKTREIRRPACPISRSKRACKRPPSVQTAPDETLDDALARLERELITHALEQHDFNLTRARNILN